MNNGATAGLMEAADTMTVTFSETIATAVGPGTTVSETDPTGSGNDRLTVAGLTAVAGVATGSNAYVVTDNTSASFASSTLSKVGATVTATVAGACSGEPARRTSQAGIGARCSRPTRHWRMPPATPQRAASRRLRRSACSETQRSVSS